MEYKSEQQENPIKLYSFEDGLFSFWEGNVGDKTVVIRVREDSNPSTRWVEKGLPRGITIHEANEKHIKEWLATHPEYTLNEKK